jgi:S1-C subfamily serine protease
MKQHCATLAAGALLAFAAAAVPAADGGVEPAAWRRTLERISSGVVAIKIDATRAFDTEWNTTSQATGFVVDAGRGLVLTNRHVVGPGPVRAEALFVNQEEVELIPVYRDPVHDFGLFRYDPTRLRYIRPVALPLAPERAVLGREIRVVGNDAGEQLSILSGTIARLRRPAPDYGRGSYNDFNTFYLQAASGTSGGSSGSPVIDIEGRAVALNAGGSTEAASSFFLPLDRVVRALGLIQAGLPVPRGTLATVFTHQPFDQLRRLGLSEATEAAVRRGFPDQIGMLVVDQVIPAGVADGLLRVGDILTRVDGALVSDFVPLEVRLDEHVGGRVALTVERAGEVVQLSVPVADLHRLAPDEYLEFGDAVVNPLSLQQARHYNRPVDGVHVANPGFVFGTAGVPRSAVIVGLDERRISTLDDFAAALAGLADRERAAVRYFTLEDPLTSRVRVIRMDRRWFPARRCRRDDVTGIWPCQPLAAGPERRLPEPRSARFPTQPERRLERISRSLVLVNFDMPYTISGVGDRHYFGTGVVIDAARGLVAVDRNTVPEAMGDLQLTFAGSIEVPGQVAYIHPIHNLAILSYDPRLLGDTPVESVRLSRRSAVPGESVEVVGMRSDFKLVYRTTEVASLRAVTYPLSRTIRFRDTNLETVDLVSGPRDLDGVILDRRGEALALWSSFSYQGANEQVQENRGFPADVVMEALELTRSGAPLLSLEVEFGQAPLANARKLGLPDAVARAVEAHDPARPQLLSVLRTVAGTPAARVLQTGDLLLSIDGQPVTRLRAAELATRRPTVALRIWRDGGELDFVVPTVALSGESVRRALVWGGALLQETYRDMAAQRAVEPYGVYVAYFAYGSPAARHGLLAGRRIVEVDGRPTGNLDAFIAAVAQREDRESLRLTTVTWNNFTEVLTVKLDETYWPGYQIRWDGTDWRRESLP